MASFGSFRRMFGAWLVAATLACGRGESGTESRTIAPDIRDSAGITIIETPHVQDGDVPRWSIDTMPSLTIGVTEGDPAYHFTRISGIRRLPNGTILVLNGVGESAYEFRFYDSAGKHIITHGRRGQGPGEYRWVNAFHPVGGDTVIAVDWSNGRVNWLSASAGHLRSARLDELGFKALLGDDAYGIVETMTVIGDSLYAVMPFREIPRRAGAVQEPRRRGRSFHIADLATGTVHDLVRYDEIPRKRVQLSSGTTSLQPLQGGVEVHVVDVQRQRICAGFTTARAIECVDATGQRMSIRWRSEDLPYTDEDWEAFQSRLRRPDADPGGRSPQDRNIMAAAWERPERYTPFSGLLLDTGGNLWVRELALNAAGKREARFRVFDLDGRLVAFADPFPTPGIRPSETLLIEDRSVLRVFDNPDGAPVVGLFRIRKGG